MLELSAQKSFPVEFKTVYTKPDNEKRIVLASNNLEFINETLELIADYTKKIDPNASLIFFEVKKINEILSDIPCLEVHSEGARVPTENAFKYNVDIQGILPRMVRIFYGFNEAIPANCHGSALVTSGAYPVIGMVYVDHSLFYPRWLKEMFEEIPLKNIDKGDLVFLHHGDHSFVFLSHDLCLSMNGRFQSLELYPTAKVLNLYGYSKDALKSSEQSDIKIYRKKEGYNYFEPVMSEIVEYWGFYNDLMRPGSIPKKNPHFSRVVPILEKLREFKLSMKANPVLTQNHRTAVNTLYRRFCEFAPIDAMDSFREKIPKKSKLAEVVRVEPVAYSSYLSIKVIIPVVAALLGLISQINSQFTVQGDDNLTLC